MMLFLKHNDRSSANWRYIFARDSQKVVMQMWYLISRLDLHCTDDAISLFSFQLLFFSGGKIERKQIGVPCVLEGNEPILYIQRRFHFGTIFLGTSLIKCHRHTVTTVSISYLLFRSVSLRYQMTLRHVAPNHEPLEALSSTFRFSWLLRFSVAQCFSIIAIAFGLLFFASSFQP